MRTERKRVRAVSSVPFEERETEPASTERSLGAVQVPDESGVHTKPYEPRFEIYNSDGTRIGSTETLLDAQWMFRALDTSARLIRVADGEEIARKYVEPPAPHPMLASMIARTW